MTTTKIRTFTKKSKIDKNEFTIFLEIEMDTQIQQAINENMQQSYKIGIFLQGFSDFTMLQLSCVFLYNKQIFYWEN